MGLSPFSFPFSFCPWILYFVAAGILLHPYPGIENDEALFAGAIYLPEAMPDSFPLGGKTVATMVMGYVGALKAWLYTPIFWLWAPSAASLRLPVILVGALTIWLFCCLLHRVAGRWAAVIGCMLLATDAMFLMTSCFDWGPVALQHLLLVSGLLLLVRFYQERKGILLAGGFFVFGLALWDKAIFGWILSGVIVAAVSVFPREIRRVCTLRRCLIAAGSLLLGAAPLVIYNARHSGATFRGKAYSLDGASQSIAVLEHTVNGNGLMGFLVRHGVGEDPSAPETSPEKAALWLSDLTGGRTTGYLLHVFLFCIFSLPWLWNTVFRRTLLFALIALLVTWIQMAVVRDAGESAHHTILLWPLLHGFIAVALAGALRKVPRAALLIWLIAGSVAASNVLVTNEYLARLIRFGPTPIWTDAVYPLAEHIRGANVRQVYAADWGMGDTLRMLLREQPPLGNAVEPFSRREIDAIERERMLERISVPDAVFVGYTDGNEIFPALKPLLFGCAREAGFRREVLEVIQDRHGRPMFEVYRFSK